MMRFGLQYFLKAGISLLLLISLAACESRLFQEGLKMYNTGKYEEALTRYGQLLSRDPDSPVLNYHAALALYRKGHYEKASEHLTKVLITEDRDLEARAVYNLGNCKFRLAENLLQKRDWEGAVTLLQTALQYYQRSLELNEKDGEAKFNLAFTERRLQQLLNNPPNQKSELQKDLREKGDRYNKALDSASRSTNTDPVDPAGKTQEIQQGKAEKGSSKSLAERSRSRTVSMSKEEAENLLEAFYREQETVRASTDRKKKGGTRQTEKDW